MAAIRSTRLRRDSDLSSDDNITILIDSYRDRRGAFLFRTNPSGAMWDAQLAGLENVNHKKEGPGSIAHQASRVFLPTLEDQYLATTPA